jgi:hypothetical protein
LNKYTTALKSKLLSNRLERVAGVLNKGLSNGSFQTQEEIIQEVVRTLGTFYKDLTGPILSSSPVAAQDIPEPNTYSSLFNEVLDDLTVLFAEFENIEQLSIANFNYSATESNRLYSRLRSISSKLGDYILYSKNPTKDSLFVSDSFNDLSKIELNSKLLNKPECNINQEEGIVTLPLNKEKTVTIKIKEKPVINPNSNGVTGNNQQVGGKYNGNILDILDGNADTWFEYERVVDLNSDNKVPLTLDLSLNLGSDQIINYIRINPNNFGTKTVIRIDDISTSLDGKLFTSIKDDIPVSGFVVEDEENIFLLAPATSKYTGQGIYTFTPRKVKYVHLTFAQTEPYLIQTGSGERLRYAIGLRDIELQGQVFLPEGEFVSKSFNFNDEIKKVILRANQNPSEPSELVDIAYFLSPDNGQTWNQIQPKNFQGLSAQQSSIPEIMNFNIDAENAVITSVPAYTLKLKATFKRKESAFDAGSAALKRQISRTTELQNVTGNSPFQFKLNQTPVKDSVQIIDPFAGSCGIREAAFNCGTGSQSYPLFSLNFNNRPIKKFLNGTIYETRPVNDSEWIHVLVDGEEWTAATAPLTASSEDEYFIDIYNNILHIGYGTTDNPISSSSKVNIFYESQRLNIQNEKGSYIANLDFATTNDKNAFTLKRYEDIESTTEVLPRLATIVRLSNKNLIDYSGITSVLVTNGYAISPTTFVNGVDELAGATNWSIDIDEGILYLKTPTSAANDIIVSYSYQPVTYLVAEDWDWASQASLKTAIQIKDSGWKVREKQNISLGKEADAKAISLPDHHIVLNSLKLDLLDQDGNAVEDLEDTTLNPFVKEVSFTGQWQELGSEILKTREHIPQNNWSAYNTQIVYYEFLQKVPSAGTQVVALSSVLGINLCLANQEKSSVAELIASATFGDYCVVKSGTTVRLYIYAWDNTTSALSTKLANSDYYVSYYYTNPNYRDQDLYSVDYQSGQIFTQRPLDTTWDLTVGYQYTDYRAEYRIARYLPSDNFSVDYAAHIVTIKPEEILQRMLMPSLGNSYYQVNYDYMITSEEKISELKDYFSPVLKDYMLKIMTKGKLL